MSQSDWPLEHARVCPAVRELVALIQYDPRIRLSDRQLYDVARNFQNRVDTGHLRGQIAVGDHYNESGETVIDWEEFKRERE